MVKDREAPDGYKFTEIGIIPEDWDFVRIGDLGNFSKGAGIRKDQANSGHIPCIRYGELYTKHNDIIRKCYSFISRDIAETSRKLKAGDVLFAGSGETKEEIGKCAAFIDETEVYAGGDIIIFSPVKGISEFYGYLLNAPFSIKQKASKGQGDAIVHISSSNLADIVIPFPNEIEQKAIAEALSDTDNLIQSIENLIDKKRKIKQGAMQQLLTGKKRLPGFSGEWEVFKLGEVVQIFNGGTPSTSNSRYWDGSIKWCTPTDITSNKSKYLSETANKITELGLNNSSAKILPIGTLLFCSRATIGEVKIANCEVATNQGFKSIVTSAGVNNEWLYYWLVQNKMSFIEKAIGSTFLEISKKDMKNIEIALPSVEEQKSIAQVLSDMDAEIEALEEQLEKYKTIKQGMMQELLTGRIRLI